MIREGLSSRGHRQRGIEARLVWVGEGGNYSAAHNLNIDDVLAPHAAGADDSVSKFASHGYRLDHLHLFGQGSRQNTLKTFRLPAEVRPLALSGAWEDAQ